MLKIKGELSELLKKELEPVPSQGRKSLLFVLNEIKTYLIGGVGSTKELLKKVEAGIDLLQHFEKGDYNGKCSIIRNQGKGSSGKVANIQHHSSNSKCTK